MGKKSKSVSHEEPSKSEGDDSIFGSKRDVLFFLPFGIFSMLIFWLTMSPTVPGGDSGELISVAYSLGVAHPPGYPLYTMLAHMATWVPIGTIAWRINMLSAVFSVLNAYVIYLIVRLWLNERWLGLLAAAIFIFSPLNWRYAVAAEVFTLNNLFVSLLLLWTLKFVRTPSRKFAYLWIGTLGLACSHHHTILFVAIPIFLYLMWRHSRLLLEPKTFGISTLLFVLGFLPYLYLPWASEKDLLISWGDTATWKGFWDHFLRREYGTFQLATGDRNVLNVFSNLRFYLVDMWYQFLYAGLALVGFGIYRFWQEDRKSDRIGQVFLFTFAFYTIVFHLLANLDLSNRLFYDVQSRFWLAPNIILSLFFVFGLRAVMERWPEWRLKAFIGATALATALQVGLHYRMEDYSKNTVFYDLGKSLLDGVPKDALIFMRGDVYVNAIRYMQTVEGYRTDVKSIPFDLLWWPWMRPIVLKHFPDIVFPGKVYRYRRSSLGEFTLVDFFEANQGKFPMYIGKLADYETKNLNQKFQVVPIGFLNKVVPNSESFKFEVYRNDIEKFTYVPPAKEEIRDKSWEAFVYYNYWDRELEKSKIIFEHAVKPTGTSEMLLYGSKILEAMIDKHPESPPQAYRNLGVAYQILGKTNPAYLPRMVEVWTKYMQFNPKEDPQAAAIQQILNQVKGAAITTSASP